MKICLGWPRRGKIQIARLQKTGEWEFEWEFEHEHVLKRGYEVKFCKYQGSSSQEDENLNQDIFRREGPEDPQGHFFKYYGSRSLENGSFNMQIY